MPTNQMHKCWFCYHDYLSDIKDHEATITYQPVQSNDYREEKLDIHLCPFCVKVLKKVEQTLIEFI